MVRYPHRTIADWTPDQGDVDAWLAEWAAAGWVPEYEWGRRRVRRARGERGQVGQ